MTRRREELHPLLLSRELAIHTIFHCYRLRPVGLRARYILMQREVLRQFLLTKNLARDGLWYHRYRVRTLELLDYYDMMGDHRHQEEHQMLRSWTDQDKDNYNMKIE